MNILIVEDEYHAVRRLTNITLELRPRASIIATLDSVEDAVSWFLDNPAPDLAFFDIQLADGLSFDIFKKVPVRTPIIFTTAFNEYAIQAFKVNSVDYLLKPIDEVELEVAFQKFEQWHHPVVSYDHSTIQKLIESMLPANYTERFLVKTGQHLMYVPVNAIAYFYSEESLSFFKTKDGQKHILDYTLDQLEKIVSPKIFFRINRKAIVNIDTVQKVSTYFNSRLVIQVHPVTPEVEWIVSRERVKQFKEWLGA